MGLLVRLAYKTVEDFKLRFAPNLSRGGVFIRTREPKPVGTTVAFELRLSTGEKVLRGEGVVRSVEAEDLSASPPRSPGMAVQFSRLETASRTEPSSSTTKTVETGGVMTAPGAKRGRSRLVRR